MNKPKKTLLRNTKAPVPETTARRISDHKIAIIPILTNEKHKHEKNDRPTTAPPSSTQSDLDLTIPLVNTTKNVQLRLNELYDDTSKKDSSGKREKSEKAACSKAPAELGHNSVRGPKEKAKKQEKSSALLSDVITKRINFPQNKFVFKNLIPLETTETEPVKVRRVKPKETRVKSVVTIPSVESRRSASCHEEGNSEEPRSLTTTSETNCKRDLASTVHCSTDYDSVFSDGELEPSLCHYHEETNIHDHYFNVGYAPSNEDVLQTYEGSRVSLTRDVSSNLLSLESISKSQW